MAGPKKTAAGTAQHLAVSSRIPLSLQAVFLASNRGREVQKPPPEKIAHKTYFRGWNFQGLGKKRKSKGTKNEKKKEQDKANEPQAVGHFVGGKTHKQPQSSPELISNDTTGSASMPKLKVS